MLLFYSCLPGSLLSDRMRLEGCISNKAIRVKGCNAEQVDVGMIAA